jgi:hypothetical protein
VIDVFYLTAAGGKLDETAQHLLTKSLKQRVNRVQK